MVILSEERSVFGGRKAFILATAASAVGLGNLWRFPTLAARHGGGTFLVTYIIVVLLFGVILLLTEIAIGRYTRKSPIDAFDKLHPKSKFLGVMASAVPAIIMPYYCVIGGWVLAFLVGYGTGADMQSTFGDFISSYWSIAAFLAFFGMAMAAIYAGVNKGIEKTSLIMMPLLLVILVVLVIHMFLQPGMSAGISKYLSFDFSEVNGSMLVDAMSQSFFSLSIAMGILITYGSYMDKKEDIEVSALSIGLIDTVVAFLAGLLIVPTVFNYVEVNRGGEMPKGADLIFNALPDIFVGMPGGQFIGFLFFVLVFLAALTSAISVAEAVVATIMDRAHKTRKEAVILFTIPVAIVGTVVCLGYGPLSFVSLNDGNIAILDMLDILSNSIMMPIVAFGTCVVIGHVVGCKLVVDEIESSGKFRLKPVYPILVKWVAPIAIAVILVTGLMAYF